MARVTGNRLDPFLASRFCIEIENVNYGGFRECTGLEATVDVFEYPEGGLNDFTHKLPGRVAWGNLVLKHGLSDTAELWDWFVGTMRGQIERKNISIVLYDSQAREVKRWSFQGAYPVKYSGPEFKVDESAVAIETLELAHQGLTPE